MQHTPEEVAAFRERVRRARAMSPEEKLCAGVRMFEEECEQMRVAIRAEHPEADNAEVERILSETLKRKREEEDRGVYFPVKE